MASVNTYLNFPGTTEEAFNFYRSAFGGDFNGPIRRMGDAPALPGQPPLSNADKRLVMHVELPILGGHLLMGSDCPPGMDADLNTGNNVSVNLHPDSREASDALYARLADCGTATMPMADAFWGDYFGALTDRFGIQWMINHTPSR